MCVCVCLCLCMLMYSSNHLFTHHDTASRCVGILQNLVTAEEFNSKYYSSNTDGTILITFDGFSFWQFLFIFKINFLKQEFVSIYDTMQILYRPRNFFVNSFYIPERGVFMFLFVSLSTLPLLFFKFLIFNSPCTHK